MTDSYFESRRILFPRFFFMTDAQFLHFLSLADSGQDFNAFIPLLFPGTSHFLFDSDTTPPSSISPDQKVLGLVSIHKELMMLSKPVAATGKDCAQWLHSIEIGMQQTIGGLIGQAVSSFPKQSLDEWILDYPLQTIMTTIHLILTHEINELFDEMARVGRQDTGNDDEEDLDEYGRNLHLH